MIIKRFENVPLREAVFFLGPGLRRDDRASSNPRSFQIRTLSANQGKKNAG
jgi:hypothetical protein